MAIGRERKRERKEKMKRQMASPPLLDWCLIWKRREEKKERIKNKKPLKISRFPLSPISALSQCVDPRIFARSSCARSILIFPPLFHNQNKGKNSSPSVVDCLKITENKTSNASLMLTRRSHFNSSVNVTLHQQHNTRVAIYAKRDGHAALQNVDLRVAF